LEIEHSQVDTNLNSELFLVALKYLYINKMCQWCGVSASNWNKQWVYIT